MCWFYRADSSPLTLVAFLEKMFLIDNLKTKLDRSYRCPSFTWELPTQKDSTFSWPLKLLAIGLKFSFFIGETVWKQVSAVEGLRRAHRE